MDHTWKNLKVHFENEYNALQKIRGITMKSTIFLQQPNAVSRTILQEMRDENNTLRAEVTDTEQKLFSVMVFFEQWNISSDKNSEPTDRNTKIDTQHSANDLIYRQLLPMIGDLNNKIDIFSTKNIYKNRTGSGRSTKKGENNIIIRIRQSTVDHIVHTSMVAKISSQKKRGTRIL